MEAFCRKLLEQLKALCPFDDEGFGPWLEDKTAHISHGVEELFEVATSLRVCILRPSVISRSRLGGKSVKRERLSALSSGCAWGKPCQWLTWWPTGL
jgi:hypothetical protein